MGRLPRLKRMIGGVAALALAGCAAGCVGEPTRFTYIFARTAAAQGSEDEAKTACRYEATKHSAAVRGETERFFRYSDILVACMKAKGFGVTRRLVV